VFITLGAMGDMKHSGLIVETLDGEILNHVDRDEKGVSMLDRFWAGKRATRFIMA
jgi:hypothetical protein